MAANPMQKKSRNAFLTGMLLMLIVAAIAMIIMFMALNKKDKQQTEKEVAQSYVYVVKNEIKSGAQVTEDDLEAVLVDVTMIPSDAYGQADSEDFYREIRNTEGEIEYEPRYKAKIDLSVGTVLSENMMYEGEKLQASARLQEYNMLQLPVQLDIGEYVDVRLLMSNGQDYIVVSHKEVIDITDSTIWLELDEDEILLMSNAIVESYMSPASSLYVTKYVEPGTQGAATVTYIPSEAVMILIQNDPNVVEEANRKLTNRYISQGTIRGQIQTELDKYSEQSLVNIETQMLEAREKAREEREEFLYGVE